MKVIGLSLFLSIILINEFAEARRVVPSRRRAQLQATEESTFVQRRSRTIRRAQRVPNVVVEPVQSSQAQAPAEAPVEAPPAQAPSQSNNGNPSSTPSNTASGPEACVATNRPSARCEDAFHTTFSLMLVGFCRLENHGYTASTFNVRRDQGCLRLRCLETELVGILDGQGCTNEIKEWFSTITEYDYSNEVCITRPNTFNSLNHCEL